MNAQLQSDSLRRLNEEARTRLLSRRGEPLFFADWLRALFIHYEVPAVELQRDVPFELDLREGRAYVSLVAFTMSRMRPRIGGKLTEWLCQPISTNEYLNVRTYVRHRGETGIYFIAEWMNNPLSCRFGPRTFGLPYRFGEIHYSQKSGNFSGVVYDRKDGLEFGCEANLCTNHIFETCASGSVDEFLLERYTAFTRYKAKRRFFRIWHSPWLQTPVEVTVLNDALLANRWRWFGCAKYAGANYSPGVQDVWMGWPHRVIESKRRAVHHRLGSLFELP